MRPRLIGIAGPSGSGKSELSQYLARIVEAPILSLDAYYLDLAHLPIEQRVRCNFDEPASLDRDLILHHISELCAGRAVDHPTYDFAGYTRAAGAERIEPAEFIVVEGLFALYWPEVRERFALRIFIDAEDAICYERRLLRDVQVRGRSPESVCRQYTDTVRPMAEKYILPTKAFADIVVSGTAPLPQSAAAILNRLGLDPELVQREPAPF